MNAALIGSVSSSAAVLRGMLRGGLEIAGVCGLHARHAERVSDFCDLRPLAEAAGVPFVAFDKVVEAGVVEFLTQRRPDWLFVVGISQLVPAAVRDLARLGAVGFHPTPLPEGRGRAPVAWTILLQKPAAANLFFLTDEADAGDIIAQRPVEVRADDYAEDLIARTNVVLEQMVVDLAPAFASGKVPRKPQDHSRATYYARRRPEDGKIDWGQAAEDVYRLVRAAGRPYPGAFCFRGGRKVVVWRARVAEGVPSSSCTPPGPPLVRGGEEMPDLARGEAPPLDAIPCTPGGTRGVRDGQEGETPPPSFTPPSPPLVRGGEAPGTVVAVLGEGPVVATARGRLVLTDIEMERGEVEGSGKGAAGESSGGEAPGISAGEWVIGERLT